MIKNYFKIAWRNLIKQKGLSFISVFGLSLGIACFSLFALYAWNEFNFDSFHQNAKNIYRVYTWTEATNGSEASGSILTPMPLGPAMKHDLPDVENETRYLQTYEVYINVGDRAQRENLAFADPSFFSVFSFKLKYGNAATALDGLHNIVLTEATANKLFGQTDVIGKAFQVKVGDQFEPFTVSAVAENPPSNSSFQFTMLAGFDYLKTTSFGKMSATKWGSLFPYLTFVQLKPGSRLPDDPRSLAGFRKTYYPDEEKEARAQGWHGAGSNRSFRLEPLQDIHTDTWFLYNKIPPVSAKTIWILLGIAASVLLIACINFTILAIGRSSGRAKEVGVRKVIGGTKKTLVVQFLTEAVLLTMLATLAGMLLAKLLLPYFNQLSGRELSFSFPQMPQLLLFILGLIVAVGLLAGIYPSLVLSHFKPAEVLKRKLKLGGANLFTRSLMTLQFVVSAALVISTVIILQQLHYMQSKDPGFNKENVLVVEALDIPGTQKIYPLLRHDLASCSQITGIACADNGLGENEGISSGGFTYNNKPVNPYEYFVDHNYIPVLGMKLLAGRNFDPQVASDTVSSVIINEAMMNAMGLLPGKAIGQRLTGYYGKGEEPVIIGVVKDFNYLGLQQQVQPQLFHQFAPHQPYHFFIRIQAGSLPGALAALQKAWKNVAPAYPLKYNFLDEDLDRFYRSEQQLSGIIGWAGGISIFLSCMGLFGIAALVVVNRTKEIGIRKILGAKVSTIISLLSKEFFRLVTLAFLLAVPVTWYLMNKWLQRYAYRINVEWWVFALTGLAISAIALFTVSSQAIKAALANPVKSLRNE